MSRFTEVLSKLDARLAVPEPARSRVLLEVAADMEDLYAEYEARGTPEAEAKAAVEEHFDLSEEVLRELVRVHDTPLQRSLETISRQVRGTWSRLLMAFLALFVTVGSGSLLFRAQLYRDSSGVTWVVMPLLALGLALAAGHAKGLYRAGGRFKPALGSGLNRLLGLAVLILITAAGGLWVELYRSALRIRIAPGEAIVYLVGWIHMASATLVIALSGALVLGFLWYFLGARVRRDEMAAVAQLLEDVS